MKYTYKYIYPAVFTPVNDGIYLVNFPDIKNCFSDGKDLSEAFTNAEDVLNLTLWNMEEKEEQLPMASDPKAVKCDKKSFVSLIRADTLAYRKLYDTKAVKKTLSIPRWLDTMAQDRNLNFSNILQNALMQAMQVEGKRRQRRKA